MIDGEIVALDQSGRPSFNTLQNSGGDPKVPLFFYVFDVVVLAGRDLTQTPLAERRKLLQAKVLPKLSDPIRQAPVLEWGQWGQVLSFACSYG